MAPPARAHTVAFMAITAPRPAERNATAPGDTAGRRRRRALPAAAAGILVLAAVLMLYDQQRGPAPLAASAPPTAFSAERAMTHVEVLGTQTRYLGSAHHRRTQRYLVARLRALGLRPQIQRTAVVNRFTAEADPVAGTVTNVLARLPGTASSGTIALNAHYDSGATGPGASDCGTCVAAVLEIARALTAGPALRNDVLFVFSDGEENHDLGAAAFAGRHPAMKDIDAVVNWDTAGSRGLPLLLGTNSSWLVEQTLASAPDARAYSALPSLFRSPAMRPQQLNLDTQEYMDRGAAGVQFVYFRGTTNYHTRTDDIAHVNRGSVQMDGAYGLALARRLGADPQLARHVGDRATYFNVTGGVIVQYGPAIAALLALLAAALFAAAVVVGLRRQRLTARGLVLGAVAFPLALALTTVVTMAVWMLLVKPAVPDLRVLSIGTSQNGFFAFGLVAFALAVFGALYQPLLRRARSENLALGALLWWLVTGVVLTLASPSAAYFFVLPALAALVVAVWRLSGERDGAWRWASGLAVPLAVLVVVYAPVMLLLTILALRLEGMGAPALGLMALFAALAAGLFVPFLTPRSTARRGAAASRWLAPGGALLLAIALITAGALRLEYSETSPRPDHLAYVLDADTGRAAFEAGDRDSWSAPLLRDAKRADVAIGMFSTFAGWRAPAPAIDLPGPRLVRTAVTRNGATSTLRLRLTSPRGADAAAIDLRAPGPITAASVQGRPIAVNRAMRDGRLKLEYVGLTRAGIDLRVRVRGGGTLRATTRDVTQGLPAALAVPRRPADAMPTPLGFRADPTIVSATAAFGL